MASPKPNLFLFCGDDTYRTNQTVSLWKDKFCEKNNGDINLGVLQGKDLNPNGLRQAITAIPFLGDKRLVIVHDFLGTIKTQSQKENLKHAAQILDEIPDFCILVFVEAGMPDQRTAFFKKIRSHGQIKQFPLLMGASLDNWVFNRIAELGGKMDRDAAGMLTNVIGGDLWRMDGELQKLVTYANGRQITLKDTELLVDTTLATSIFTFTDAIARKDAKKSLKELHALIETGEALQMILHMIIRQFRLIIQMKDLAENEKCSPAEIISKLKQHPFVVQKTLQQIRNFSLDQLKKIYDALLTMDTGIKTGKLRVFANDERELVLALDRLVLDTCKK